MTRRYEIDRAIEPNSVRRVHLGAREVEVHKFFGLAGMDGDGERHAGRALEKDRLVLDAVGAEDEMGEGFVRDDLLAGMAGLSEIDGRRRIFGGGVLVALEGEIDEQARCRVAARSAALRRIDERLASDEIV